MPLNFQQSLNDSCFLSLRRPWRSCRNVYLVWLDGTLILHTTLVGEGGGGGKAWGSHPQGHLPVAQEDVSHPKATRAKQQGKELVR